MNSLISQHNDAIQTVLTTGDLQPSTRHKYRKALEAAQVAGVNLHDPDQLTAYANTLSASTRNNLKSALRLWSDRLALKVKGSADPDNLAAVQATVYRLEALNEAITVKKQAGSKAHTWLSQAEVKRLLETCQDSTLACKRDRIVLGLLVGAGLRREELAALTFESVTLLPVRGKFRTVLNVTGKGAKDRAIPLSDRLAAALDKWQGITGGGRIARSITRSGLLGESLSAVGIFQVVAGAGAAIGKPGLAPHDLRRTFAQLGYEAGVPITQISKLLGHASVATTQRYLNLELDLESTVSDFIPF